MSGAAPASSNRPTIALVLGILGVVCCGLVAPVAWFMGSAELKAIRAGSAPAAGEGLAKAGMILGIIGTVLLLVGLLWIFFAGGMAILQAMGG
ncbi:MAG: DUF4190 domain-containing protein [Acidobacteria bacterium]|nr:DUF4190 domain-containing protein [Acidobacteriota bacterium]